MSEEKDNPTSAATRDFAPGHHGGEHSPVSEIKSHEDLEDVELGPRATYINTGAAAGLSQEHRDYLLQRHGTLELDPIPSADPAV